MSDLENMKISATLIAISKDGKALIVQRPKGSKFENLWTVAGGKIKDIDGIEIREDPEFRQYSAECAAMREFQEETGIELPPYPKIRFLCTIYAGKLQRMVVSFYIELGKRAEDYQIKLDEPQDYRWITKEEIKNYKFIPDIGGEINQVFNILKMEREKKIRDIME
jgi:8-oxo-dGTP pyrophosphatase MutT (NUDIX family)